MEPRRERGARVCMRAWANIISELHSFDLSKADTDTTVKLKGSRAAPQFCSPHAAVCSCFLQLTLCFTITTTPPIFIFSCTRAL
jgi:hypothetical protein